MSYRIRVYIKMSSRENSTQSSDKKARAMRGNGLPVV
jgi:hypothetical protein